MSAVGTLLGLIQTGRQSRLSVRLRSIRIWLAIPLAGFMGVVSLTSCGSTESATLRIPLLSRFTADPARAQIADLWPQSMIDSGLYTFDVSMNVIPNLAVGLPSISANGKSYAITIRDDARFDDGSAVTASDVAYSFARALSPKERSTAAWRTLRDIVGARAVRMGIARRLAGVHIAGRRSLYLQLTHPDPGFLIDLALPAASVLEQSIVQRESSWWMSGASAAPFEIGRLGNPIVLKSNPHYDEGKLSVKALDLEPLPSASAAQQLFSHRKLDASPLPPGAFAKESTMSGFQSTDSPTAFFILESGSIPISIRTAIASAIDRSSLSTSVPFDPLDSAVPAAVVPDYPPAPDPYTYQPQLARASLANGPAITIGGKPSVRRSYIYSWIVHSLRSGGAHVIQRSSSPSLRVIEVSAPLPDPQIWLHELGQVVFQPASPRFSALLTRADGDIVSQGLALEWTADNQAEGLLLDHARLIPIAVQKQGYLIAPQLQGLSATPVGLQPSNENWTSVTN